MEPSQLRQANSSIHHNQTAEFTLFPQNTNRSCFTLNTGAWRAWKCSFSNVSRLSWADSSPARVFSGCWGTRPPPALPTSAPPLSFPPGFCGESTPFQCFLLKSQFLTPATDLCSVSTGPSHSEQCPRNYNLFSKQITFSLLWLPTGMSINVTEYTGTWKPSAPQKPPNTENR